jgi:hypothetical protein
MTLSRNEESKHEYEKGSKIVVEWMQELLKDPIPGHTLQEKLADGVVLCKIANAIKPGAIRKFHRSPKMLMMKMENIAFFLAIAKSRFNVPKEALFSPQDLQDEPTPDFANMLRVVSVMLIIIKESGYKVPEMDSITFTSTPTPTEQPQETADSDSATKDHSTEPEPEPEPDPELLDESGAKTPRTETSSQADVVLQEAAPSKGSWYLEGKPNSYINIQEEVKTEILQVIHEQLSVENKIQLAQELNAVNTKIQEKLLFATDEELRVLCFEMGLGDSLESVTTGKDRKWYIDWIISYGRSK